MQIWTMFSSCSLHDLEGILEFCIFQYTFMKIILILCDL